MTSRRHLPVDGVLGGERVTRLTRKRAEKAAGHSSDGHWLQTEGLQWVQARSGRSEDEHRQLIVAI